MLVAVEIDLELDVACLGGYAQQDALLIQGFGLIYEALFEKQGSRPEAPTEEAVVAEILTEFVEG